MTAIKAGMEAPVFELPLLGGGQFALRTALEQSPVVLVFFKISCPVCQYSSPLYESLAQKTAGRLRVLGVSQDNESATHDFAKRYGMTFEVALDDNTQYPVSNGYGLTNVPTLFEITQTDRIAVSCVGWDKAVVEDLYRRYALPEFVGIPLFAPAESVADFRAG